MSIIGEYEAGILCRFGYKYYYKTVNAYLLVELFLHAKKKLNIRQDNFKSRLLDFSVTVRYGCTMYPLVLKQLPHCYFLMETILQL